MQVHAENQPLPDEVEKALDSSQRLRLGSGASILRFINNILKPKPPTIHSGAMSEAERDKTLAPFAMSGIEAERVNRDYEAFFTSAWGGKAQGTPRPAPGNEGGNLACSTPNPISSSVPAESTEQSAGRSDRPTKQERPVRPSLPLPVNKPRSRTSGDVIEPREERVKPATPVQSPLVGKTHIGATKRTPLLPPEVRLPGCARIRPPEIRTHAIGWMSLVLELDYLILHACTYVCHYYITWKPRLLSPPAFKSIGL